MEHRYFHNVMNYSRLEGEYLWLLSILAFMTNDHGWGDIRPDADYASFDPPDPSCVPLEPHEIRGVIREIERAGEIVWDVPRGAYRITVEPPGVTPKRNMPSPGYVYLLQSPYGYKIGRTNNLRARITAFGIKLPFPVKLIHTIITSDAVRIEKLLHQFHAERRIDGEWFNLTQQYVDEFCALDSLEPIEPG